MKLSSLFLLSALFTCSLAACHKDDDETPASTVPSEPKPAKPSSPEPTGESGKDSELLDMPWRLVWLDGTPFEAGETPKPVEVTFDTKEQRVHGTSGCNRFFGTYTLQGSSLTLGQMGSTRMACPEGMDKEQQILTALGATGRFRIADSTLELYDKKDQLRLKLVPAAPKPLRKETP